MRTRKFFFAFCFGLLAIFAANFADAQTYSDIALQNSSGNYARVVPFAPVTVCQSSDTAVPCTTPVTTYVDQTLAVACTLVSGGNGGPTSGTGCNNPGIADANGNYTVFLQTGTYRVCVYAQNYVCILKTAGAGIGSGAGTPNLGDCLIYNAYGDSLFDLAACPGRFIQVIGDGADPAFAVGSGQNAQTIGTFSVFPATATEGGGNTYTSAASASTNDVLDVDEGFGASTGGQQNSFGSMRRYSVRLKLNNSTNVGYWWGLANAPPQFGTSAYSTLTPNTNYCMFRYRAGTDTTIKAACGTSSANQTLVDTTVALDTTASHVYDIVNVGGTATSFRFLIDGVARATISTTLPAATANYGTLAVGDNQNTATAISFVFFISTLVLK